MASVMRFASICFLLVLLHVGQGYRVRHLINRSKAVSDMHGRGWKNQKEAAAKESNVDRSVLSSSRPSQERLHSFADLKSNLSSGSSKDRVHANDSLQAPEAAAWYEGGYACSELIIVGVLGVCALALVCILA
eukprot:TRINITY_DN10292_c0_g1_i1.p2 TRINITY_DN10292_c0_g1~~TRINITY_DN10292_c0_g1_i1.p2  ORF type:complete len:145 (+),score=2.91 TRINITY_DN10292_c0_g1_i1:38-436(+)